MSLRHVCTPCQCRDVLRGQSPHSPRMLGDGSQLRHGELAFPVAETDHGYVAGHGQTKAGQGA